MGDKKSKLKRYFWQKRKSFNYKREVYVTKGGQRAGEELGRVFYHSDGTKNYPAAVYGGPGSPIIYGFKSIRDAKWWIEYEVESAGLGVRHRKSRRKSNKIDHPDFTIEFNVKRRKR